MEGGLKAPVRHPHGQNEPDYLDADKLDAEIRRIFDICHGCRRCFNLCDSFPRLFDLVDGSATGELDSVDSKDFGPVMDACTLCDLCFMVTCPYVPPHEFDLDFPHLVLRYRAQKREKSGIPFADREMSKTDRNGRLAGAVAPLANWATRTGNGLTRPILEKAGGIHCEASLPEFHAKTFVARANTEIPAVNENAPAFGRKAAIYATCFANYNNPDIGMAARKVLAHNGVETEVVYPGCCGMPQLEHAEFDAVADKARLVSAAMEPWIDKGYQVIALVPSCALMLKFEWPLILPGDETIEKLSRNTADITEYIVDIAQKEGLAEGLSPLPGGIALHLACHARAQNMGPKAVDMLKAIPEADLTIVERCSGHGGSWGVKKEFFEVALKVGRPAARTALKASPAFVASECPLAAEHLRQGMERLDKEHRTPPPASHPIQLLARAYGF